MSATFAAAAHALQNDAELRARVTAATSPEERAELLRAAGIEIPTESDVEAGKASMSDVAGGAGTYTQIMEGAGAAVAAACI